jgi:ATP-dependent RNA helicase SUPV3L1/SUV3
LARGVAYQLVERFGVLDRRAADDHIGALSRSERRVLKSLGVRFGAFSLYLPGLMSAEALAIGSVFAELAKPRWRPSGKALSVLPHPAPAPEALSLRGLTAVAGLAIPVLTLEKFDALSRETPSARPDLVELNPALLALVGWTAGQAEAILRALGFVRIRKSDPAETSLWRRRSLASRPPAPERLSVAQTPAGPRASPPPSAPPRKGRRRRPRRRSSNATGTSA